MKTKLQLLIAVLMIFKFDILSSQTTSFPTENAVWKNYCHFEGFYSNSIQEFVGDSLHNGLNYQKISSSNNFFNTDNSGLTRVDNNRVYFIPKDSINEILLYDFNLELGDTFQINSYFQVTNTNYVTVVGVDSIMTFDGVHRKVFYLSEGTNWIEGIGAEYGSITFPWYFISISGDCHLYCYSRDSIDVYEKQYYRYIDYDFLTYGCTGLITSISETEQLSNLIVYPNPFDDEIIIKTTLHEVEQLTLYNSNLKIVDQTRNRNTLKLNSKLISGFYILEIKLNGKKYYRKVIKK